MTDRERVLKWLAHIGETDQAVIDEVINQCRTDKEARAYYVGRSAEVPKHEHFGDKVEKLRQMAIIQGMKKHSGNRDGKTKAGGST